MGRHTYVKGREWPSLGSQWEWTTAMGQAPREELPIQLKSSMQEQPGICDLESFVLNIYWLLFVLKTLRAYSTLPNWQEYITVTIKKTKLSTSIILISKSCTVVWPGSTHVFFVYITLTIHLCHMVSYQWHSNFATWSHSLRFGVTTWRFYRDIWGYYMEVLPRSQLHMETPYEINVK